MENEESDALNRLWQEYAQGFRPFDDLTLARWLAQTLGQLVGSIWRASHPLVAAYRVAVQVGLERQIWHKRLVLIPAGYATGPCCRAPLLPLLTRDVANNGLVCFHCGETAVPFGELPATLQPKFQAWARRYGAAHEIAHWEESKRQTVPDYDEQLDQAAQDAARLLAEARDELLPPLLSFYPAVVWEDHDECLDVRPEDIPARP